MTVGDTTATSVRLTWPAGSANGRYGVVLNGRTLGWTPATAVRITGLRPGTEYRAQILLRPAGTNVGAPYTEVVSVRTAAQTRPTGWFSLGNALTGGAADLYGARTANGTPLVLQGGTGSANQLWRLNPAGSGTYTLQSKATGKCVTPLDGAAVAGSPLVQQPCTAGAGSQLWRLTPTNNGFTLSTADGRLVVGPGQGRFAGQRLLVLQQPGKVRHQAWTATPA